MKPKFTPGPWNFHRSYAIDSEVRTIAASANCTLPAFDSWSASIASGDMIIAEAQMRTPTGGWPHITDLDEAKANAKLITAAPEMYEALKNVEWSDRGRCPQCANGPSLGHQEQCTLGAALAKAEGGAA